MCWAIIIKIFFQGLYFLQNLYFHKYFSHGLYFLQLYSYKSLVFITGIYSTRLLNFVFFYCFENKNLSMLNKFSVYIETNIKKDVIGLSVVMSHHIFWYWISRLLQLYSFSFHSGALKWIQYKKSWICCAFFVFSIFLLK